MARGSRLLLALLALPGALALTGCGDDGPVELEVTVQDWSGWQREQPEPERFTRTLAEGDTFTVDVLGEDDLEVTLVEVDGGEIAVETSARLAVDGGLRDLATSFSFERGGSIELETPTLDAGTRLTLAER